MLPRNQQVRKSLKKCPVFEAKFPIFDILEFLRESTDSASKLIDRTDGCASQFHFIKKKVWIKITGKTDTFFYFLRTPFFFVNFYC